jgi:hypothetical protein
MSAPVLNDKPKRQRRDPLPPIAIKTMQLQALDKVGRCPRRRRTSR